MQRFTYTYDALGNVISRTDARGTVRYAYDAAGQLAGYDLPDGARVSYSYDGAGNRLTETTTDPDGNSVTRRYTYDAANRLTGIAAGDGAGTGHALLPGAAAFTHDANGNLVAVTDPNGHTTATPTTPLTG